MFENTMKMALEKLVGVRDSQKEYATLQDEVMALQLAIDLICQEYGLEEPVVGVTTECTEDNEA